ncbi:MAG: pilin [Proteobacteria bacterium]|nr:pilin [Pseudomonadota bacterium]
MSGSNPKKLTNQGKPLRSELRANVIRVVIALAIVGVLGSIGIHFQIDRIQKTHSGEAVRTGELAARFSQIYYLENAKWPTQAEFSSQPFVSSHAISAISIDDNGTIKIVMAGQGFTGIIKLVMDGRKELNGKIIQFTPTVLEKNISWTCVTDYKERRFPEFLNERCNDKFARE